MIRGVTYDAYHGSWRVQMPLLSSAAQRHWAHIDPVDDAEAVAETYFTGLRAAVPGARLDEEVAALKAKLVVQVR